MEQIEYDHHFYEIVEPYHHEFDMFAAACDPRIRNLAEKHLDNNRHVDYDMIWQVADDYKISREDVLDYACTVSMQHVLDDANQQRKYDDSEGLDG